ncbi:MAG: 3-hydroxyacyl-ACP dehydratase FabZ [Ruminococcaceae bacterium]|nr:3-hydroxyacyl-ACP dehydratase FabZ [Oscillospiraceae bacterium]
MLENTDIQAIIPHRYPFLLVDRIIEMEEGVRAVGIKNVTVNEPFFQGHFPGFPIMPGVLILEALAQTGAAAILSKEENKGKIGVFAGVNNFKFKKQVFPGDTLRLEAEIITMKMNIGKANARAYVGDKLAAGGEITFAIVDGK